ncbi:MAG: hypothetical protein JW716_04315 [Candidatus Aenigmarchaeota archaeon]|nr:hypothetical protein [Candidatus Aenigmarchaeota archaeon]
MKINPIFWFEFVLHTLHIRRMGVPKKCPKCGYNLKDMKLLSFCKYHDDILQNLPENKQLKALKKLKRINRNKEGKCAKPGCKEKVNPWDASKWTFHCKKCGYKWGYY